MSDESILLNIKMVPLVRMPYAHQPFKCAHKALFMEVREAAPGEETAAGRVFFEKLGQAKFEECYFHQGDWRRIAEAAVMVVEGLDGGQLHQVVLSVSARLELGEADAWWLWSLFDDPISWRPGEIEVVNGQHRLCALRAAGVDRAPVDVCP